MWTGISLHNEVLPILAEGSRLGKVHSVFNKVINLVNEEGCMISLLARTMDNCPISILVDIRNFEEWKVLAGEDVRFEKDKIVIGRYLLDISKADPYNLKRGVFKKNSYLLERNLAVLKELVPFQRSKDEYDFNSMAFQMVLDRTSLLKDACLGKNNQKIIETGRSLLGLGQGLTPSGDDVLMGLFLILGLCNSPVRHLDNLLERILQNKGEETTDVSYQGLIRASKGFYRSVLVETAEALTRQEEVEGIIKQVLAIGHTSGRDLLYGILTGYEILMEKEKRNVN